MLNARRFLTIPSGERKLFLEAVALIGLARVVIAIAPFRFIPKYLELFCRDIPMSAPHEDILSNLELAIGRAAQLIPSTTCLTQALACVAMMKRRGYPAKICIGVAKRDGNFGAHAWVECNGDAILGSGAEFSRICALPEAKS